VTPVPRAPLAHRGREASQVLKDHRGLQGQREKKVTPVLTAPQVRRGNEASQVLKGHRDLQGQKEIPPIPAGCNSWSTAFQNWKRNWLRQAKSIES